MDGYLRDSRHSWDMDASQLDLTLPGLLPPGERGYPPSRIHTRETSRTTFSSFGGDEQAGAWEIGPMTSLVPLRPMHYAAPRPPSPFSRPSSPSPLRMSYGPEVFDKDLEYHYQNWSQTDLREPSHQLPVFAPPRNESSIGLLPDKQSKPGKPGKRPPKDPNLVTFAGPQDPFDPKNFSLRKRWVLTIVVSSYAFISPVSSSVIAPALSQVSRDMNITSEVELKMTLSIFVLAYAIGPLFLGPLSEVFGRARVLQLSALFYLAFNLACGFARTPVELIVLRFLAGLGGSAPLTIGGGVLGDIWQPAKRGKAVGIYQLAPLLGPAIGPIAGGFVAQYSTWRWVFWATSIVSGLVQACGLLLLEETYAPTLLKRKAKALRATTGNHDLYTEYDTEKTLPKVLRTATARPFRMLTTQPIIQVIALYMAYIFGLFYLLLSSFPRVYRDVYGEPVSIAGLHYLSLGTGFVIGAQINANLNIRIYRRLKTANGDVGRPEFRIPQMFFASPLLPVGLLWYGWAVYAKAHWIVPDIGIVVFGIGSVICLSCMQVYIIDSYTRFSASGIAAAIVLRSLAGFGFPLFAQYVYSALGYGWGNSILAFVAIIVGVPAPYFFWRYGEVLRKRSTFAAG